MNEPSPERLRRARARGEVPVAGRLSVAVQLAAALATLGFTLRSLGGVFDAALRRAVSAASSPTPLASWEALGTALVGGAQASGSSLVVSWGALVLVHLAQTRALVAWPSRAPWRAGSPGTETRLTMLWGACVGTVSALGALGALNTLGARGVPWHTSAMAAMETLADAATRAAWAAVGCAVALGVAEFFWRRWVFRRRMTPTRTEAERERRDAEGDAQTRAALRQTPRAHNDRHGT